MYNTVPNVARTDEMDWDWVSCDRWSVDGVAGKGGG